MTRPTDQLTQQQQRSRVAYRLTYLQCAPVCIKSVAGRTYLGICRLAQPFVRCRGNLLAGHVRSVTGQLPIVYRVGTRLLLHRSRAEIFTVRTTEPARGERNGHVNSGAAPQVARPQGVTHGDKSPHGRVPSYRVRRERARDPRTECGASEAGQRHT